MKRLLLYSGLCFFVLACNTGPREATTESGYRIVFHEDAPGEVAQVGDHVTFHYSVMNEADEVLFDSRSTGDVPQTNIPDFVDSRQNSSAVLESLKMCSVGDSITVYYPVSKMAVPPVGFDSSSFVVYNIILEDLVSADEWEEQEQARLEANQGTYLANKTFLDETVEAYNAGELDGQLVEVEQGLKILVHEEGEGELPQEGQRVFAHYLGVFAADGSEFDNSFLGGDPLDFQLGYGGVIQGWDLGFAQLKKGAKATLFIPSALAYGERGYPNAIPPNADLIFYVEMIDIQ